MQVLQDKVHKQEVNFMNHQLEQMKEKLQAAQALNLNLAMPAFSMPPSPFMMPMIPPLPSAQSQSLRLEYTTQAVNQQQQQQQS